MPILLQGSPDGYPIYKKYEFEMVQYLDVDLRKWAPKADGDNKGYDNYQCILSDHTTPALKNGE